MKCLSALICLMIMGIGWPVVGTAGGWTQKKDGGYFAVSVRSSSAEEYFAADGEKTIIPIQKDVTLSAYAEYGATDRLTLVGYVPIFKRLSRDGFSNTGIADIEAGIRLGFLQEGPTAISGGATFGLPVGDDADENDLLTGDGEFNVYTYVQLGQALPLRSYLVAETGFNNRTGGFSDEVGYSLELGHAFAGSYTLIGRIKGMKSIRNGDETIIPTIGSFNPNDQRFLTWGAELLYAVSAKWGVSLGYEELTTGINTSAGPTLSFGVYFKR